MLVLWAYAHRAERLRARSSHAWIFYGLALLFFAMGLMCKPMLVTVPCVLLLLDYWPLKRLEHSSAATRRALLIEKIPFFALSAAASAVTLFAQRNGGTVQSVEDFPWPVRLANALIAYCQYLGKCFVPDRLAVFYPYFGEQPPLWQTLLAALLLVGITVAAVALHRRRPYLLVGWLWFVGTLVPVIGLVQIGGQSMADRYSYVPLIGVFVIVAWAACDATASWPGRRSILGITAGTALITLGALTSRQLGFWKDGVSLFGHAIAVTENNWMAHASLAATLSKSSPSESSAEYQETMRIIAAFAETHDRKGVELDRIPGHASEAIEEFRTAVRIMPVIPGPHYNLGTALAKLPDHLPEAIEEFRTVVRLKPDLADAHYNLGTALANSPGHLPEAIEEFQIVVRLEPDAAEAHYILGRLLASVPGRTDEALGQFESALKIKPDMEQAREMIARLRAAQQ
jgi:tetratricopeptide (TPR) repeat protein